MILNRSVGFSEGLVPVGDDGAAERVGGGQGHEGDGVEGGAPQKGVYCDAASAAGVIVCAALKQIDATGAEDALSRVVALALDGRLPSTAD